jgi:hypothetical protein
MDDKLSYRPYIFPTILLAVGGWGGLIALLNYTLPTLWPRWAFFALIVVALTGTALPVAFILNRRFPTPQPILPNTIVREATWFGVYGATLAWLLMGRVLTFTLAFGLAGGLIVIEYLLRMRERIPKTPSSSSAGRE